jgi:hypothetical protein
MTATTRPASRRWAARGLLLAFGLCISAASARAEDCIATYDKQGRVTGQYCPDGKSRPPQAGAPVARAPQSIDPESTVPAEARDGAQVGGGKPRSSPKGVDIQCGKWKSQSGGCRGIFTILK